MVGECLVFEGHSSIQAVLAQGGNESCYDVVVCNTEAKMPTIRKTMKIINMHARSVSITAMISSGALSVNTKKY